MCIVVRVALAFVFIYHGIVPKLIFQHADEIAILREAGADTESAPTLVLAIGVAEVLFGVVFLALPRARWPFMVTIVFGVATLLGAVLQSPHFLVAAFNPVSLNIQMIALCVIGLLSSREQAAGR